MQQYIASYLFQTGLCPLPGLGKLELISSPAVVDFVNKQINAPGSAIRFEAGDPDPSAFVNYLAAIRNINDGQALEELNSWIRDVNARIKAGEAVHVSEVGSFKRSGISKIEFEPETLPAYLRQPVPATRVIHPEAEHLILVGDKETTSTMMTEYYNEEEVHVYRWWIPFLILLLISIAAIIYYYNAYGLNNFGNVEKVLR